MDKDLFEIGLESAKQLLGKDYVQTLGWRG